MLAICYVILLFTGKSSVINKYLNGRRLKAATLLLVVWFIHRYSEAYIVYQAGESVGWKIPKSAIQLKLFMQTLSLLGGGLTALFIMGCKFGDK